MSYDRNAPGEAKQDNFSRRHVLLLRSESELPPGRVSR